MADISKIKLPDGTTYDLVGKVDSDFIIANNPMPLAAYNPETGKFMFLDPNGVHGYGIPKLSLTGRVTGGDFRGCVVDISSEITPFKDSGNWSIGSDDGVYRISACRNGCVVSIAIAFHGNGSAVSAGSNGFIGNLSAPAPMVRTILSGFYNSCNVMAVFDTDGSLLVRPLNTSLTLSSASRLYLSGTFVMDPKSLIT